MFSGIAWSLLQTAGSRLLSMVILLILARLLGPEAFGIVTIAFVVLGAMTTFVDLGVADVWCAACHRIRPITTQLSGSHRLFSPIGRCAAAMAGPMANALKQPCCARCCGSSRRRCRFRPSSRSRSRACVPEMSSSGWRFAPWRQRLLEGLSVSPWRWAVLATGACLPKALRAAISVVLLWASSSYRRGFSSRGSAGVELVCECKHLLGSRCWTLSFSATTLRDQRSLGTGRTRIVFGRASALRSRAGNSLFHCQSRHAASVRANARGP